MDDGVSAAGGAREGRSARGLDDDAARRHLALRRLLRHRGPHVRLVILLSALGVLAFVAIIREPTIWNGLALAAVTCSLEYSHYWAFFLVGTTAVGSGFLCPIRLAGAQLPYGPCRLGGGTCGFAPWLPTFIFQLRHTGTPWATPADFTALVYTFTQFAGGNSDAGRALALLLGFLALLAIFGSALDGRRVVLDLRVATRGSAGLPCCRSGPSSWP